MAFEFSGNTTQYGTAHANRVFAVKVDPFAIPAFTIIDETIADANGDFNLDLGMWSGRVIVVAVDDDGAVKINAKANDWVLGKDTVLGTSEINFLGSDTNKLMITASSEISSNYVPSHAFDGVVETSSTDAWISTGLNAPNQNGSCWLQWDFGVSKTISQIAAVKRYFDTFAFMKDVRILSSDTGLFSGEEVDQGLYQFSDPLAGEWSDYITLSAVVSNRYFRMEILSGTKILGVATQEIKFKELI